MKTQPQFTDELSHLCKLIESIDTAMLTTLHSDGVLHSRPMHVLEMDSHGKFFFYTDMLSEKTKHLTTAHLSLVDTSRATYVSVSGHAVISRDTARIKQLWTVHAKPWFPKGPDSADLGLLVFTPTQAEYWDAPNSKMVRMLAMAASLISGKPAGSGDHDVLENLELK